VIDEYEGMTSSMYRLAANSYSYIHSLSGKEFMERLARHGFSRFELMIYPGHFWPDELASAQRQELAAWMRQNDLQIVSLNPPSLDINLASMTPEMRTMSQEIYKKTIELAADIECEVVVVTPGKASPLFPAPQRQMVEALYSGLDVLVPVAERLGVRCALENVPIGILPAISDVLNALDEYGSAEVGVTYDIANGTFIGENASEAILQVGDRLAMVHLSDTTRETWRHAEVGSGVVPFADVVASLKELSYAGPCVLEIATRRGEADVIDSAQALTAMGL
jgi:L-ribulose-5-phosphate 3-epimerase